MIARVDYWTMSYENMNHSWIVGKDYDIHNSEETITVVSEAGTQEIPKKACVPELFLDVFGMEIY